MQHKCAAMCMWLKLLLLPIHCVVGSSANDPLFLLRLTGSIEYDVQIGGPRTTNFSDCAAWCRNTPRCRGMAVEEMQSSKTVACRVIQFDEYKFIEADPEKANGRIYLRQFTFWNETKYDFATQQSISVTKANGYIQRLKTFKLTRCLEDIPVFRSNALLDYRDGFSYRLDNKTQTPCDSTRNHCSHGCPQNRPLVIEHQQGGYIVMKNSIEWPATCYNGEWMYFEVAHQLVYPVLSWNCAEKSATTTTMSLKTVRNENAQGAKATKTSDPWNTTAKTPSNSLATGLGKTLAVATSESKRAPTNAHTSGITMKPSLTEVATATMTSGPPNPSATEKAAASKKTSASSTIMNATSTSDTGLSKSSPATATVSAATTMASGLAKSSAYPETSATLIPKTAATSMAPRSAPTTSALTLTTTLLEGSTKTTALSTAKAASTTMAEGSSKTPASGTARTVATTLKTGSAKTESEASGLTSTLLKGSTKLSAESTPKSASTTPVTVSVNTPAPFTKAALTTLITDPAKTQTQIAVEPPNTGLLTSPLTTVRTTKKPTTKKPTTKKPTTKKRTTKKLTTKKLTTKKPTTKKPTTKKPTTKKPTTKKPTTKKPTTKKPTTVKKTTKRTTKKKITTPKTGKPGPLQRMGHGVDSDGVHNYFRTKPEMPTRMAFQPLPYCHALQNKPGCNMVQFGTTVSWEGHHVSVNSDMSNSIWKQSNHIVFGYCARDRGSCGANVKVIVSRINPYYKSILYVDVSPRTGSSAKNQLLCYMWALENGVCPV